MRTRMFIALLLVVLLASFSVAPEKVRAKAFTETYRLEDVTQTLSARNACFGSFKGTLTYDALIHITENDNSYHIITLWKGTAVVEPANPDIPSFTGRFSEMTVEHTTSNKDFKVQIITQMGDGLEFHITFKVSFVDGVPTVEVFNTACGN